MGISIKKIDKMVLTSAFILSFIFSGSALSICVASLNTWLMYLVFVIMVAYLLRHKGKIGFRKAECFQRIGIFFLPMITMFISGETPFNYAWSRYFLTVILAWILVHDISREKILLIYRNTMLVIAVISLVGYVVFNLLGFYTLLPTMSKLNESSTVYYTAIIYNILNIAQYRNCGIFWEPSIFAAYLSLALIVHLFFIEKSKIRDTFILAIAILTTNSTGGYILLILITLIKLLEKRQILWLSVTVTAFAVIMTLFSEQIIEVLMKINPELFGKLFYFADSGSSLTRYYSSIINLRIWLTNPILGIGLPQLDDEYLVWRLILAPESLAPAQTSTSTIMLASLGIAGIYYNYLCIKASWQKTLTIFQRVIVLIIIFFIVNQTPHTYFVMTYILLFAMIHKKQGA